MTDLTLFDFSNRIADAVGSIAPSVVQVLGRRRPISGLVYASDLVITTTRALGRGDHLRVTTGEGRAIDAEAVGWDPATSLVLVRVPSLEGTPPPLAETPPRVGHLGIAVARSWSNAVTATAGLVAVMGGPLPTGRGRAIDQVIRTTAPMHDGFAGGAFADASGRLVGLATAAQIRGFGVIIPASIVWKTAADLLQHGGAKRGYIGVGGQTVRLTDRQQQTASTDHALLIVSVTPESPADRAGIHVGDVLVLFDGRAVGSPEALLALLQRDDSVGRAVNVRVLRGADAHDVTVTPGERPIH